MLSFFPFLLFFFSLLQLTPLSEADFFEFMMTLIPNTFRDFIAGFIQEIFRSSKGNISLSIVTALLLSSKAFISMQQGLNSMYRVKEQRKYIRLRVGAVIYSLLFALIIIAMLVVMVFGKWINRVFLAPIPFVGEVVHYLLQFRVLIFALILFFFFWGIYVFLPNQKRKFLSQIPGAVFSTLGWMGFSMGFSIYVEHFSNYASFYGTMTTIALVMVWLYGCMYMFFIGGLINSTWVTIS